MANERYMLFAGSEYDTEGGAMDLTDVFNNILDLEVKGNELLEDDMVDWWHIFDAEAGDIISAGGCFELASITD